MDRMPNVQTRHFRRIKSDREIGARAGAAATGRKANRNNHRRSVRPTDGRRAAARLTFGAVIDYASARH